MSFSSLGLSSDLLLAIAKQGYTNPYPIQIEAIPAILNGKDVFGVAQTGSGKTAGFALPILQLLKKKHTESRHIRVLVIVPTRELAIQIADVFGSLAQNLPFRPKTLAIYGGVSINPQMMQIQGTDILVATPGRLLDLINSNAVHLNSLETLVLDEADKILNLGFKEEMDKILALVPKRRQTLLFSATKSDDVKSIKAKLLSDPIVIEIIPEENNFELISQLAYHVIEEKKGVLLRYLIKHHDMKQVLVFVSSVHKADHVVVKLNKNGINAVAMHSKKSQGARTDALRKFKSGELRVMVATDLASRGIDIIHLPYVINYELPRSPTDYIHRIGRTGRAGSPGEAISLITETEMHHFGIIQKKMGKKVIFLESENLNLHGY